MAIDARVGGALSAVASEDERSGPVAVPSSGVAKQRSVSPAASGDALEAERFFEGQEPRLSWELVEGLLSHPLPMQVRELMALLWDAITHPVHAPSPGGGRCEVLLPGPASSDVWGASREERAELTPEELQRRLDEHGGNIERTAKALGMKNRYVLRRLIAKLGLEARAEG